MPELPEVETIVRGIGPHITTHQIKAVIVRNPHLRVPVELSLKENLIGEHIKKFFRRGKYMLMECDKGTLLIHLGMSGRLRLLRENIKPAKHDHIDIIFSPKLLLRFTDPRRFGLMIWIKDAYQEHRLLKNIGIEPLNKRFDGDYLLAKACGKKISIKNFLMDSKIVAGIGNIYASEALFLAKIHPLQAAGKLSLKQMEALARGIKTVLKKAIKKGGTTLKDYVKSDGTKGLFSLKLNVYGRENKPCRMCHHPITKITQGQRSTFYCKKCLSSTMLSS